MGASLSTAEQPPERVTIRAALERQPENTKEDVEAAINVLEAVGFNCDEEDVREGYHELTRWWFRHPPFNLTDKQALTISGACVGIWPKGTSTGDPRAAKLRAQALRAEYQQCRLNCLVVLNKGGQCQWLQPIEVCLLPTVTAVRQSFRLRTVPSAERMTIRQVLERMPGYTKELDAAVEKALETNLQGDKLAAAADPRVAKLRLQYERELASRWRPSTSAASPTAQLGPRNSHASGGGLPASTGGGGQSAYSPSVGLGTAAGDCSTLLPSKPSSDAAASQPQRRTNRAASEGSASWWQ